MVPPGFKQHLHVVQMIRDPRCSWRPRTLGWVRRPRTLVSAFVDDSQQLLSCCEEPITFDWDQVGL